MQVFHNPQRGAQANTHPAEGGHKNLQETEWATTQQQLPTPGGQTIPDIKDAKKRSQERHSDPVVDGETSLPSASLGGHLHKDGLVPRIVIRHSCEHIVGRKPQDNFNSLNENHITEVMQTLLQRVTSWVLSQRNGNPITPIRSCHGTITGKSIPGNNHDHWAMVQKYLPPVHPD